MLPAFLLTATLVVMSFQRRPGHEQALHHILPWPAREFQETYEITMGSLEVVDRVDRNVQKPPLVLKKVVALIESLDGTHFLFATKTSFASATTDPKPGHSNQKYFRFRNYCRATRPSNQNIFLLQQLPLKP
jgi:hypothetical protein